MTNTVAASNNGAVLTLIPYEPNKKTIQPLASQSARNITIDALAKFADADAAATLNLERAGKLYYHLLHLSLDELIAFLREYCTRTNTRMPELPNPGKRGRPVSNGRNLLAACVYGKYPGMLTREAGKRDSRAGKQITMAVNRYMRRVGLSDHSESRKDSWPTNVPRSARGLLQALVAAAVTKQALDAFGALCQAAFGKRAVKMLENFQGA